MPEPIKTFRSKLVPLAAPNVDTDQIIPARYLKVTDKSQLGQGLFADWRYRNGQPVEDFVLNQPEMRGRQVLLAGDNFGCGSSREHAPWALVDYGFRAIISTSFADIFRNNSLKNGLLPVVVGSEVHQALFDTLSVDPEAEVVVDLQAQNLTLPDGQAVNFQIDPFARTCLLQGVDELGYLLNLDDRITEFEKQYA
ncbi:MAG: 3-isopropylmalate dehydratase small subunit [Anaerolineae bacterium]|nr:3-isopropylmalate dehydratase small subunit [Anaerolineae bacterium]